MLSQKTRTIGVLACGALLGGTVVVGLGFAPAQPEKKPAAPAAQPPMDQQKMMEQWMDLMKPGKAHESFKKMEGDWDATMRVFMAGPGAPPMESKGKAKMKMVLGGKFLLQEFEGDMMGMPFSGMGLTGFDNFRKVYVGTWADTMGTGIQHMTGGVSPDGKVQTMFSLMDEPSTGEIGKHVKYVTRETGPDSMVFEAWEVMYGDDFKVFEIAYTRKK